jgi:hypothetical protein
MLSICFQAQTLYANRCLVTGREGCRLGVSLAGRKSLISYGLQELCRVRRGRIALPDRGNRQPGETCGKGILRP